MNFANIPMKNIGPIKISGNVLHGEYKIPLATFESPLWPSVDRGARLSTYTDSGISITFVDDRMTRSVLFEAPDALTAVEIINEINKDHNPLTEAASTTSNYVKLEDVNSQIIGNLIFLRFSFETGNAAGHNMCTLAAEAIMNYLLERFPSLSYESISGNYCTDKKVSAVNGILGRGKYIIAEITISKELCGKFLKTTPERLVQLNVRKNLLGSLVSGSVRSANAHVANMLLAFYLATGQDAANIVEGSQAITFAEVKGGDLYFTVTLPNLILGTIGNGKNLDFVKDNLELMGFDLNASDELGAKKLAGLCAATVLCGELSLLAAQTNQGELMDAHKRIERS
jgi:hydroxymethylglutaryl-CoA reductase (NADPH)